MNHITYELAVELKKAGFPQRGYGFHGLKTDLITGEEKFENVYYPTLDELIEACGKTYGDPRDEFSFDLEWSIDTWFAGYSDPNWNPAPGLKLCTGSTPKEAVAKLYIALNKK